MLPEIGREARGDPLGGPYGLLGVFPTAEALPGRLKNNAWHSAAMPQAIDLSLTNIGN
jgi:hypothetical protein